MLGSNPWPHWEVGRDMSTLTWGKSGVEAWRIQAEAGRIRGQVERSRSPAQCGVLHGHDPNPVQTS